MISERILLFGGGNNVSLDCQTGHGLGNLLAKLSGLSKGEVTDVLGPGFSIIPVFRGIILCSLVDMPFTRTTGPHSCPVACLS